MEERQVEASAKSNGRSISEILRASEEPKYKISYIIVPGRFPIIPSDMNSEDSKVGPVVSSRDRKLELQSVHWEYQEYIGHLNQVIVFANQNKTNFIIATGGPPKENTEAKARTEITEGSTMRDFFLGKLDIKPEYTLNSYTQIKVEESSKDSIQNIVNANEIIFKVNEENNILLNESKLTFFCRPALFAKTLENVMTVVLRMDKEQQSRYLDQEYNFRLDNFLPDFKNRTHLQRKLAITFQRLNGGMPIFLKENGVRFGNVTILPFREQHFSFTHLEAIADPIAQLMHPISK